MIPTSDDKPFPARIRPARAEAVSSRINDKIGDYGRYGFTDAQSGALNIFFDLVQEFESEEDFHAICVMVPKVLFELDCALYLVTRGLSLVLVGEGGSGAIHPLSHTRDAPAVPQEPFIVDGHCYYPIRANAAHIKQLPFTPPGNVIGCLEIHPADKLDDGDTLFWEKYANRIGFQMHNRIVHGTGRRHLHFIRRLAKDIGHNVIVPNMYFKLFFNRLKRTIDQIGHLPDQFDKPSPASRKELLGLHSTLHDQFDEISRHYEQTSLYLETLLRQSHFEKGHYVLEKRPCHVPTQIIEPQFHQYLPRLEEQGISVAPCPSGINDPDMTLAVDMGLIAQVFSNLFSNALKYTAEPPGGGDKAVSCSIARRENYLDDDRDAVVFSIFTTGPPLPPKDGARLFRSGFRAGDNDEEGTGHGLFFIKQIVEMHGGQVTHEATNEGNAFHVALPADSEAEARP